MFLGQFKTKFSGKGRIILPKILRSEVIGRRVILSRGFEGCIWGFSEAGFEQESNRQLEISATEERARMLRRYLFSASQAAELDDQSRFVIPKLLLDYAKLRAEVVIIGAGDHFEIWDSAAWEKHIKQVEEIYGR